MQKLANDVGRALIERLQVQIGLGRVSRCHGRATDVAVDVCIDERAMRGLLVNALLRGFLVSFAFRWRLLLRLFHLQGDPVVA